MSPRRAWRQRRAYARASAACASTLLPACFAHGGWPIVATVLFMTTFVLAYLTVSLLDLVEVLSGFDEIDEQR